MIAPRIFREQQPMMDFMPGLRLCESFYRTLIAPELHRRWPGLTYSAGLLGWGSDVLGFDTPRSTDHMWGPRLVVFLPETGHRRYGRRIMEHFRGHLPSSFKGYSTHFGEPDAVGVRRNEAASGGPIEPMIDIFTPSSFLNRYLGIKTVETLQAPSWLTFQEQSLLEVTSGKIFHDGLGSIDAFRKALCYYPHDVWLYKIAHAWQAVADEIAFTGRCRELGDAVGMKLIVARQVQRLMTLCFLLEKTYAPYAKWFGCAFDKLRAAARLKPLLEEALTGKTCQACEDSLIRACQFVARKHNRLGITEPGPAKATLYFGRPYKVLWADIFAENARNAIQDPVIQAHTKVHRH